MTFKFAKLPPKPCNTDTGNMFARLAELDEKLKPQTLAAFISRFGNEPGIKTAIFNTIANIRESLGRNAKINHDILCTTVQVSMKMSAQSAQLFRNGDAFRIEISYDLSETVDIGMAQEKVFTCVAEIIAHKCFGADMKKFHINLAYYLLGFDPLKEAREKEITARATEGIAK